MYFWQPHRGELPFKPFILLSSPSVTHQEFPSSWILRGQLFLGPSWNLHSKPPEPQQWHVWDSAAASPGGSFFRSLSPWHSGTEVPKELTLILPFALYNTEPYTITFWLFLYLFFSWWAGCGKRQILIVHDFCLNIGIFWRQHLKYILIPYNIMFLRWKYYVMMCC